MLPIICQIGPATIYSYGLMLAMAVIVCTFLLTKDAKREGIGQEFILDLVFWTILGGILGARIFFVILNLSFFLENPFQIFMIQNGGLAFQGGLILGGIVGVGFVKKKKQSVTKLLDLSAPYLALGHGIGRIGCFLNGCCYGRHLDWGIFFPVHGDHLHPTQLYATIGLVVIYFVLKRAQKSSPYGGSIFILYLILASVLRFSIEFFRADHVEIFLGLSIFQLVCMVLFFGALYVHSRFKSR